MAPTIQIRTEINIKASAKATFETLIDTSTWPDWNVFVPQARVVGEEGGSSPKVLGLGSRCRFLVKMNGKTYPSLQKVTVFDTPREDGENKRIWRVCWVVVGYPGWSLRTLRFNEVEEVGVNECVYRTGEDQEGLMAHVVKMMFGGAIEKGIQEWAEGLKKAMEG